jgi:hypothetical protein
MRIYIGDLLTDERALVVGGLKRWAVHLALDVEFTESREHCDLALLDADHPQYVLRFAQERVISVGQAKIFGANAHVARPLRSFQLAVALADLFEAPNKAVKEPDPLAFLHSAAA